MISDAVRDAILDTSIRLTVEGTLAGVPYVGPLMKIPGVQAAVIMLVEFFVKPFIVKFQQLVNFKEIDNKNEAAKKAADEAKVELGKTLDNPKASKNEIEAARKKFRDKYRILIGGLQLPNSH